MLITMEDFRDLHITDLEHRLYHLRKKYNTLCILSFRLSITSIVLSIISLSISILKLYGKI